MDYGVPTEYQFGPCKVTLHVRIAELINSIEITIAIDIFGTIAIAIVKRISQLLLLIRSSISIDFFSCLEYAVFELLQWA